MKIGVVIPQGWTGEYAGWTPERAWTRTRALARQAERLGFDSIWAFDHFTTMPDPRDELTFESFTTLAAIGAITERVRLGHLVMCSSYRNPALVAKMIGTLDVITGGRMEIGLGAGWKQDEWLAYGYGFPPLRERLERLGETLQVVDRMLRPGHASFEGRWASVTDAINEPKGLQSPRPPIIVGGNGRNVTWRLAARYADELNLDWVSPEDCRDGALQVIAERCEEVDRDPATLRVSIHMNWHEADAAGARRQEVMGAYRDLGIARLMILLRGAATEDDAYESLADDARAIGAELVTEAPERVPAGAGAGRRRP